MRKITTRTAEISFDELTRVLKIKILKDADIELADSLQNNEAIKKLTNGERYLVLVDGRVPLSVTKEVRAFSAQSNGEEGRIAEALIVTSTANKLMANFYINVNKPKIPTRTFSDETSAMEWLEGYLYRTATNEEYSSGNF